MKWHKVSEELPPIGQKVICFRRAYENPHIYRIESAYLKEYKIIEPRWILKDGFATLTTFTHWAKIEPPN